MTITKTDSNTYHLEVFYPKELRGALGVNSARYRKTFATLLEAKAVEKHLKGQIKEAERKQSSDQIQKKGDISFEKFYQEVWWPIYTAGGSGRVRVVPSVETQLNTKNIFKLHLLPMFGKYTLTYLNVHKQFVVEELAVLSEKYANIRTIKAYVRQLFEVAEIMDFIDFNRVEKALRLVGAPKKERLAERRRMVGGALTAEELIDWLDAARNDYETGKLILKDYLLLLLTLHLGDRKSESYGLQWKHVDLTAGTLLIVQTLKKSKKVGPTKGRKETIFHIPNELVPLLTEWKEQQASELAQIGINVTREQFLFTYTDFRGGMNQRLHSDYLNYRLNSIYKRHLDSLVRVTPHKLRHTFSTLARQGGASLPLISEALTHSDISTTKIYVNTPDEVQSEVHDKFAQRIAQARKNSIQQEEKML
ncbi:site-specific integrase [Loigolactobacillus coryniformis]|uniref:site-specific integrase n=1 Tax=Loigolactobacillus coryniformis TaxID=1610 RepID=UPI001C5E1974|nr:site-specific integrase [Loigolactobacillus coryniformis]MBW4801810.1 tyrosine-type recombinase/integrase [Loigolactobacillus coryniformis subsp. torquens]MBW4804511.1 tyrosine-type recombinase/integrase [Loigolactobacillus coryniformis subsp. torquens]